MKKKTKPEFQMQRILKRSNNMLKGMSEITSMPIYAIVDRLVTTEWEALAQRWRSRNPIEGYKLKQESIDRTVAAIDKKKQKEREVTAKVMKELEENNQEEKQNDI